MSDFDILLKLGRARTHIEEFRAKAAMIRNGYCVIKPEEDQERQMTVKQAQDNTELQIEYEKILERVRQTKASVIRMSHRHFTVPVEEIDGTRVFRPLPCFGTIENHYRQRRIYSEISIYISRLRCIRCCPDSLLLPDLRPTPSTASPIVSKTAPLTLKNRAENCATGTGFYLPLVSSCTSRCVAYFCFPAIRRCLSGITIHLLHGLIACPFLWPAGLRRVFQL